MGTTNEFANGDDIIQLTDMVGGGPFELEPGEWTDDTSMALCLGQSLIERAGFDPMDQMRKYQDWFQSGYMSSNGTCFDIGGTVRNALVHFDLHLDPFAGSTDPDTAGNGSLMRLAPVAMYYHWNENRMIHFAAESSKTTHGAKEAVEACMLFSIYLRRALVGQTKDQILERVDFPFEAKKISNVANQSFSTMMKEDVRSGGYVIESLEGALYCFYHSTDFEEAILSAANLGYDADTTAAICGQLAGAHYGKDGIPISWLKKLVMKNFIETMAKKIYRISTKEKPYY